MAITRAPNRVIRMTEDGDAITGEIFHIQAISVINTTALTNGFAVSLYDDNNARFYLGYQATDSEYTLSFPSAVKVTGIRMANTVVADDAEVYIYLE
jgi:hypothetical protein